MRRLFKFVALFLATIWLPVTMCCALEAAAGVSPSCMEKCDTDSKSDAKDACSMVENGHYQSSVPSVRIAPPLTDLCTCLLCVRAVVSEPQTARAVYLAKMTRERDWVPIWQFERRAAAPAHAPDSLTA